MHDKHFSHLPAYLRASRLVRLRGHESAGAQATAPPEEHRAACPGTAATDPEWDLEAELFRKAPEPRLFNWFPRERVEADLERKGILRRIRARGYQGVRVQLESPTHYESRFRLFGCHPSTAGELLLIDCRTHQAEIAACIPGRPGEEVLLHVLFIDWITLQDPSQPAGKALLPGQAYPGLGVLGPAMRLTLRYVRDMGLDGAVNVPLHYHNAALYAPSFRFLDPHREGWFAALTRDLGSLPLATVTQAFEEGRVEACTADETWLATTWTPAEQVYPCSQKLYRLLTSPAWRQHRAAAERTRFRLLPQDTTPAPSPPTDTGR